MSRISLNKTQWSKIQPHLSGRAATGRPPADDKRTLEAILFVLTTGVDGALFPLNTAVMSRHGEDIGDGHKMEPLTVYGTCSFLSLNSKENLISKNVHWMARLFGQSYPCRCRCGKYPDRLPAAPVNAALPQIRDTIARSFASICPCEA